MSRVEGVCEVEKLVEKGENAIGAVEHKNSDNKWNLKI